MSDQGEIARDTILDHAQNPRHWGLLPHADVDHTEENPLCGDALHLTLCFDDQQVIREIGWEGHGCAISQASASMLGERLIGMTLDQARQISREEMMAMIGIPLSPNRIKCALLPLKVLLVGITR